MMRFVRPANLAPLIATAFVIAAIASLAFLSARGNHAEAGATITIEVSSFKFCTPGQSPCPDSPLDTTVAASVGNTISFQLVGGFHTASHCTDGTFTNCSNNLFDFAGGSGDWLIPASVNNSNVYFRCNVHPSVMRGLIVVGSPPAPTTPPPPTASPTAAPTAAASATPTAAPTTTVTATPPLATATPAATLSGRSDVNCDGETDGDDVLALLLHAADAPPSAGSLGVNGCAPIGSGNGDGPRGDLNCDGLVDARDALVALYGWAGFPVPGLPAGCLGP